MERNKIKNNSHKTKYNQLEKRVIFFQIFINLFCIFLIWHLFSVQVIDKKDYKSRGIRQRTSSNFVIRGSILDRNNLKLASDDIIYEVYAHPGDYTEDRSVEELAKILSPYLKISTVNLLETLLNSKQPVITLKRNVDKNTAMAIKKLCLREISIGKKNKRIYPQGPLAAHILGYYNPNNKLSSGVERIADDRLTNIGEKINFEYTRDGNVIYGLTTDPTKISKRVKGQDVKLTIDAAIQLVCEKELQKTIQSSKAKRGTVIVMNPKNGEILAYASYPTYSPGDFYDASSQQLKNWSLTDIYPPGSTFKIVNVASAMELGKINENTKIEDTGKMKIGLWTIKNYDYSKHPNPGLIDLVYLFEHSSNIGSAKIALMMNPNEYYSILRKFGFGQKTGIDLPAESSGLLPKPMFWDISRQATMGFGYGASVTAIQMVSAISAIANNGVRVTPHIIKYPPEIVEEKFHEEQVISPETAHTVTRLLVKSIEHSKSPMNLKTHTVAAKTGTSRKNNDNGKDYSNQVFTSAIGYLPANDPKVLIYVVIDSPQGDAWGNTIAAPVFKEVAYQTVRILGIPSDKRN